jgi:hypothetical protein
MKDKGGWMWQRCALLQFFLLPEAKNEGRLEILPSVWIFGSHFTRLRHATFDNFNK